MALRNNKRLSLIFGIVLILIAGALIAFNNWPQKKYSQSLMYFSDDDGKTWYTDNVDLIPPYKHNGKDAVGAIIYSYAGGSKQFCGFLFRFPDSVKQRLDKSPSPHSAAYGTETTNSRELKAPNSSGPWVAMGTAAATEISRPKAPDGSELDEVLP